VGRGPWEMKRFGCHNVRWAFRWAAGRRHWPACRRYCSAVSYPHPKLDTTYAVYTPCCLAFSLWAEGFDASDTRISARCTRAILTTRPPPLSQRRGRGEMK
jgi:hypothetical protein